MSKTLSVIIPTYNRCAILKKTLEALAHQEQDASRFDVIVVDDGSSDDTSQIVRDVAEASALDLRYAYQENKGAGAARNRGLRQASGDIILFLDDDIVAFPGLMSEHLRFHRRYPASSVAVLGQVMLAPEIPATQLNTGHVVHRWRHLQDGQEVDWRHFITCNISVKRSFMQHHAILFDESLPRYQDSEIGYRCSGKGLRIRYNARAIGYHYHNLTLDEFLQMNEKYGRTLASLHQVYPQWRTMLGEYLLFSWRNSPGRVMRDLVRPVVFNDFAMAALLLLSNLVEKRTGKVPASFVRQLGHHSERRGYRRGMRDLREIST